MLENLEIRDIENLNRWKNFGKSLSEVLQSPYVWSYNKQHMHSQSVNTELFTENFGSLKLANQGKIK